ncbi:MAG: hypothetical protein BWY70_01925 [Bacteroidetes bacterium ADurb.Bin408]|nr:MAG: hypothetical protein BWY70_01925 [Bacteroidetes bacterium ADurb.Bin408]
MPAVFRARWHENHWDYTGLSLQRLVKVYQTHIDGSKPLRLRMSTTTTISFYLLRLDTAFFGDIHLKYLRGINKKSKMHEKRSKANIWLNEAEQR